MPPLVGGRQPHLRVFTDPVILKLDAGASHRRIQLLLLLPILLEGDDEEVPPKIEVGADPQKSLTQGNERRYVLDLVGIEVLWLYLVVVQQSSKESVGGGGKPALMEAHERDDMPSGGDGTSSSSGNSHSSAVVRAQRRPRRTRPSKRWRVFSERHHGSIGRWGWVDANLTTANTQMRGT